MPRLILLVSVMIVAACNHPADNKSAVIKAEEAVAPVVSPADSTVNYTFAVFSNDTVAGGPGDGYGYRLYRDGKRVIEQPQIPAVTGVKAFASIQDAEATAALAIIKIQKGVFPPTISIQELDSIGVKH